jgi:hypothetical protein
MADGSSGNPLLNHVIRATVRMGQPPRSFVADAHYWIVVGGVLGRADYKFVPQYPARWQAPSVSGAVGNKWHALLASQTIERSQRDANGWLDVSVLPPKSRSNPSAVIASTEVPFTGAN